MFMISFDRYGEVKSAKHCPNNYCAFVNFAHPDSASKAMKALQGCDLAGNKKVILRWPDKMIYGKWKQLSAPIKM